MKKLQRRKIRVSLSEVFLPGEFITILGISAYIKKWYPGHGYNILKINFAKNRFSAMLFWE